MVNGEDPVTNGIKEWDKVRKAGEAAIEQAHKARSEAEYYRGQCELMEAQRKADIAHIRQLQQHCDEMILMIDALGAAVLSILEKRNAGFFRKAGSVENGNDRLRSAADNLVRPDILEHLTELARTDAKRTPAAGH